MLKTVKSLLFELITSVVFIISVIPGFNKIGNLPLQCFLTVIIIFAFLLLADGRITSPFISSIAVLIMSMFWIIYALVNQMILQVSSEEPFNSWIYQFYYDKPSLIILSVLSVLLFYTIKLCFKYNDDQYIKQYIKFRKISGIVFILLYIVFFIYCFVVIRTQSSVHTVNLKLFHVFTDMKNGYYEYEFIFLFFANIAIFYPLGLINSVLFKSKHKVLKYIAPFLVSIGIETIQFFTGNGMADIDDVVLNVIGYYLGILSAFALDKIIINATKGKLTLYFNTLD